MARTFLLQITCESAAFDGYLESEIVHILREAATEIQEGEGLPDSRRNLRDSNGNTVGDYRLLDKE